MLNPKLISLSKDTQYSMIPAFHLFRTSRHHHTRNPLHPNHPWFPLLHDLLIFMVNSFRTLTMKDMKIRTGAGMLEEWNDVI